MLVSTFFNSRIVLGLVVEGSSVNLTLQRVNQRSAPFLSPQALETILCEKPSINAIYRKATNIDFLKKKIFNEFS